MDTTIGHLGRGHDPLIVVLVPAPAIQGIPFILGHELTSNKTKLQNNGIR